MTEPERTPIPVIRRERGKEMPPGAVYVGRGSRWGNPFVIGRDGTREEVIEKYRRSLDGGFGEYLIDGLAERRPTALACWCAPEPCHADVLAEMLAAHPDWASAPSLHPQEED